MNYEPLHEWRYEIVRRDGHALFWQLYWGDFCVSGGFPMERESIAKSIVDEGNAARAAGINFDPWERTFADRKREIAKAAQKKDR